MLYRKRSLKKSLRNGIRRLLATALLTVAFSVGAEGFYDPYDPYEPPGIDAIYPYVGSWACHMETDYSGISIDQILKLDIDRYGGISGGLLQTLAANQSVPRVETVCSIRGSAEPSSFSSSVLQLNPTIACTITPSGSAPSSPPAHDGEGQCVGADMQSGSYKEMYCLDFFDELLADQGAVIGIEGVALCKRR